MSPATAAERMTIAAARELSNQDVCFVGIGAPSEACNLARLTHAPDIVLIYESGTLATQPDVLPLSIGDGELSKTALTNVSVPEMFRYWLQGGHISVGFLGGAQIDRFANLNSTVIGDYDAPKVRLPGAGGAPEIAAHCGRILVVMKHARRAFVPQVDFVTSFGFGKGGREREERGLTTKGMQRVITDLCILEPSSEDRELEVVALQPEVTLDDVRANTAWDVRVRGTPTVAAEPTAEDLEVLRDLKARTEAARR
ncbi:MAG: CoA-transferase subunit beta [Myxococcota bacterium]